MGSIPSTADAVVIGGGPSGSSAAARLAQEGFDVVLLEKARHPRPTVGESLIPHFWRYTDMLGATEAIEQDGFIAKAGGLVYWEGLLRQIRFKDFGYTRPGMHVERDRFDEILLRNCERVGAKVFEETPVTAIEGTSDEPVIRYRDAEGTEGEIRPRFVIDASGQAALVARKLGVRQFDPDIRFMALWGYYKGGHYLTVEGDVVEFGHQRDKTPCTVVTTIGDWGWVWHIIMRDVTSIGIILPPDRLQAFKAVRDTKEAKFQGLAAETPLIGDLLQGAEFTGEMYGIRDYSYLPVKLAEGNCYLVGDAAAFVDPINSAGVVFGMWAGIMAAWSVQRAMQKPERNDAIREMYCKMYQERLQMLRLLALPADAEGVPQAVEESLRGVALSSRAEQQLALMQATLNARADGLIQAFERLGIPTDLPIKVVPMPDVPAHSQRAG